MIKFNKLFNTAKCAVIAMVHAGALPGTPLYKGSVDRIISNACKEVEIYLKYNIDGIIIENMHDIPYVQSKQFTPETIATMTAVCYEIHKLIPKNIPCGVQVLAGGNKEALAIAQACSFHFIRAEGFVFSHIADEGFTDANAGQILRYRTNIKADDILVFADIKKKHSSHAITNDISLVETAKAAEFFLADGVILTGSSTGNAADVEELKQLLKCTSLPVLVGSGVTDTNLHEYINANALIVGSYFKKDGKWQNELDENRIRTFMDKRNLLVNK